MIPTIPYAIGFIIYVTFNIVTFNVYSKGKEYVNYIVLYMIYIYYTILAGYIINLTDETIVNNIFVKEDPMIIAAQILVYAIAGGLFLLVYYKNQIKSDEKFADKEGSF